MALTLNEAECIGLLDDIRVAYAGGSLAIYDATDTLLVTITLPDPAFASPAGTVGGAEMDFTGTWSGTGAATGTPSYYILQGTGGRERQGDVGAEMTLTGLEGGEILQNGFISVSAYTITQPGSAA